MTREESIALGLAIEAASQNVGVWYPTDYGLQICCSPGDIMGQILIRARGEALGLSAQLPAEAWQDVPGTSPVMEVCVPRGFDYGVVQIRGDADAWWWEARE